MRIYFATLGCKVNQYETEFLSKKLVENGWQLSHNEMLADIYIINSCTVTSMGDKKTRQTINHFRRINKKAIIVLTGCWPQAFPIKASLMSNVDIITGNTNKSEIPKLLSEFMKNRKQIISILPHNKNSLNDGLIVDKFSKRTRALVKIQDGCCRCCSYCIIPKARGYLKSKPLSVIKKEIQRIAENGYSEVVLVGINISSYGLDFSCKQNPNLVDVVKLACSVEKIERVRLGSIEPDLLTSSDIISFSKERKFCPHFHIALQSGSDSVLKRMNRHYSTKQFKDIINEIFKFFKNPSITTDLMVGFPKESVDEFKESINFVKSINFYKMHIFPYSIREGTPAANMSGQLTRQDKKKRVNIMKNIDKELRIIFFKTQMQKIHKVLFETKNGCILKGYTENYILVCVEFSKNLCGHIKSVKIVGYTDDFCIGKILNE